MQDNRNEFAKMSELVKTIVDRYRKVRKGCGISDDDWHSRSIESKAKPFIQGYYTLAIVGKVSAGKSTFINALLGCKNLLPTGHDQTTCGITYIEYGQKIQVSIVFGDDKTPKTIPFEDLGKYVAIPEEFHDLPVNHIDEMIMGGLDFKKIWECHGQLEKDTLCSPIDKNMLKSYVDKRKKKDIPVEVYIKYPFDDALKGWRIIDTPGIGAIGGIEDRTRQLLAKQKEDRTREVDAIIFLQNGSKTLDESDSKKFMMEQLENFTLEDRDRLFFVLTHGSSPDFLNNKDKKLSFINKNYGDRIKCLSYVDSLLYSFLNDLEDSDVDLKNYDDFQKPSDWSDEEWDVIMSILDYARRQIKKDGDTFNHDTMLRILQEWSHFDVLKSEFDEFAKTEKFKQLHEIVELVANDYLGFVEKIHQEKVTVDGDLVSINAKIKAVENKRKEYNVLAQEADNKIRTDNINSNFGFIESELLSFESLSTISSIRTAITNLFDKVQKKEKEVFENIIKTFSVFFKDSNSHDIILDSVDFSAIEREATNNSKYDYEIAAEKIERHMTRPDERIPAKYETRINETQKIREFKAKALIQARKSRDKFLPQVKEKVENMRRQIFDELDRKIKYEIERLEFLKTQLHRKEEFKAENDRHIAESHSASKELIKLVEEYER